VVDAIAAAGLFTPLLPAALGGVHFLRKRKSSLLIGVGEDAAIVAHQIAKRLLRTPERSIRRAGP